MINEPPKDETMSQADVDQLIDQVQVAHRICVAYYQRLFSTIDFIAKGIQCNFKSWDPITTDRPSQRATYPGNKWAWDFVPIYASRYTYTAIEDADAGTDYGVKFEIYVDDVFRKAKREELKIKGEPDPITMERGQAVARIRVYKMTQNNQFDHVNMERLMDEAMYPITGESFWVIQPNGVAVSFTEILLSQFISAPDQVIQKLKSLIETNPQNMQVEQKS